MEGAKYPLMGAESEADLTLVLFSYACISFGSMRYTRVLFGILRIFWSSP